MLTLIDIPVVDSGQRLQRSGSSTCYARVDCLCWRMSAKMPYSPVKATNNPAHLIDTRSAIPIISFTRPYFPHGATSSSHRRPGKMPRDSGTVRADELASCHSWCLEAFMPTSSAGTPSELDHCLYVLVWFNGVRRFKRYRGS